MVVAGADPADLDVVRYAFRLGWAVAELRGRYRPDRYGQRDPGHTDVFARNGFELPLASERSPAEIRKELVDLVEDLSGAVELTDADTQKIWTKLKVCLEGLDEKDAARTSLWSGVAHRFYELDAHIQDTLVLQASQAAAYQLGRGLAETYWALQPASPASAMGSWEFLLGVARCETLRRLAARLSPYFGSQVLAAIDGPLEAWAQLAADQARRSRPGVEAALYEQVLLWRDLVRKERLPGDLQLAGNTKAPAATDAWKDLKLYQTAVRSLLAPLIGGVVSIGLLAGGGALLASGSGETWWTTIASILGALGLTSAGLYARAKANVTSLLANLSQTVQIERIRQAANLCPDTTEAAGPAAHLPAAARPPTLGVAPGTDAAATEPAKPSEIPAT